MRVRIRSGPPLARPKLPVIEVVPSRSRTPDRKQWMETLTMKKHSLRILIHAALATALVAGAALAQEEESCQDICYETEEGCYQACESVEEYDACTDQCSQAATRCLESCD